jgi:arylsulfatase A-like enzyme
MRKTLYLNFVISLFLILLFLFTLSCNKVDSNFHRYDLSKELKSSKGVKLVNKPSKNIPVNTGYRLNLKGTKIIRLKTKFKKKAGILFYMNFTGLYKNSLIEFELYKRNKKKRNKERLHYVKTNHFDSEIIEKFNITNQEEIILKFKGTGKVFISNPVFFKLVDKNKRNNVFIVAVDTFRGDMLSKKINGISLTPNMDVFKKDSVYFSNCIAPSSWTLPSFVSFFTSLNEFNHNVGIKTVLNTRTKSLIEYLSQKYITLAFHGGIVLSKRWGHSRGFDLYEEFKFAGPLYPYGGKSLFEKALDTLKRGDFPNLLLFLHTYQIHDPYTPPKEFLNLINKEPLRDKADTINSAKPQCTFLKTDKKTKKSLRELYQAEIIAFDSFFGTFIKKLKEMKLYNSSTIVIMSDHGEEFFEHGGWAHSHSLYQEIIRVPFIIKFPANKFMNTSIARVVSTTDILPTLLEYEQIEFLPKKIDGHSLMNLIRNKNPQTGNPVISAMTGSRYIDAIPKKFAIIIDNLKLIYNYKISQKTIKFFEKYGLPPKVEKIEIYNIVKDPNETINLYKKDHKIPSKFRSYIKKIKRRINRNKLNGINSKKQIDKEVEKQLKTIGYI